MEIKIDTKYNSIIEEQQPDYWYKFEVNKKAKYTFVNTSQITYMNYRFTDKDQVEYLIITLCLRLLVHMK